jgi:hypothetical protein
VTPEIAPRIEDRVRARARRSYERGRLTVAGRNALLIVPLTAICGREAEAYARCAVIGALLLLATIGVRWRQWRGPQAANAGLLTGILPMTAALLLCRFAAGWPAAAATAACASAGLIAGALAVRATLDPLDAGWREWSAASLVAGLTAALGCIGIGFGTAVGSALGVAAGAAVTMRAITSS